MAPIKTPLTNYIPKNHSLFIEFPCIWACNLVLGAKIQPPHHTLVGENIFYYYIPF
jgi:hypothetical protein